VYVSSCGLAEDEGPEAKGEQLPDEDAIKSRRRQHRPETGFRRDVGQVPRGREGASSLPASPHPHPPLAKPS
jgi:hypothetical protein